MGKPLFFWARTGKVWFGVGRWIIGGGLLDRGSTLEGSGGDLRLEGSVFDEPSLSAPEAPALEERLFSRSFSSYCFTLLSVIYFLCPFSVELEGHYLMQ
jgi:hypothetical protein